MTDKNILYIITIICLILNTNLSIAQDNTINPLLYYYSTEQQAFVIETALGDKHSKLIDFRLCSDCWIIGSGWSVSGKWFVWGTELIPTPALPDDNEQVYLTNADGTEVISLTSSNQRSRNPLWSPVSDLLLYEVYNVGEIMPSQFIVFDVSANEQIWTWDLNQDLLTDVDWLPSGDIVIYSSRRDMTDQASMIVYSLDEDLFYERNIRVNWQAGGVSCNPIWSEENEVIYINSNDELIFENSEQELFTITAVTNTNILSANWSPDSNYAIVYTSDECTQSFSVTASAWVVSWENDFVTELSNDALFIPNDSSRTITSNWSPNSKYWSGIFVRNDDLYEQLILNIDTLSFATIQEFSTPVYPFTIEDSIALWKSNSDIIYFTQQNNEINIFIYHTQNGSSDDVVNLTGAINSPNLSPDGTRIAFGNFETCNGVCVVDIENNIIHEITTYFGENDVLERAEEVIWHSSGSWFFILGRPVSSTRSINIGSIDGNVRSIAGRFIISEQSAFGWMPDHYKQL